MTGFKSKKDMANAKFDDLMYRAGLTAQGCWDEMDDYDRDAIMQFAQLVIEETLNQVDERVYGRGENSWYYDADKKWVRLHFGYGELYDEIMAGAKNNAGNGGYSIGTKEAYDKFVAKRNQSLKIS